MSRSHLGDLVKYKGEECFLFCICVVSSTNDPWAWRLPSNFTASLLSQVMVVVSNKRRVELSASLCAVQGCKARKPWEKQENFHHAKVVHWIREGVLHVPALVCINKGVLNQGSSRVTAPLENVQEQLQPPNFCLLLALHRTAFSGLLGCSLEYLIREDWLLSNALLRMKKAVSCKVATISVQAQLQVFLFFSWVWAKLG